MADEEPRFITGFNNASLREYNPYVIDEEKGGVYCPVERVSYVEGYLQRRKVPLLYCGHQSIFLPSEDPKTLKKNLNLQQMEPFNYEYWYCKMKGIVVFDTNDNAYDPITNACIIPLCEDEVKKLHILSKEKQKTMRTCGKEMSNFYTENYQHFASRFDDVIEQAQKLIPVTKKTEEMHEYYQEGFFVRLSGRSPKDYIAQLVSACQNGIDVTNRLLCSTRSSCCFSEYLSSDDPAKVMSLIILPWDNNLNAALEFRCFVYKKKLTAISQYDCYNAFEMFQDLPLCRFIRDLIQSFFDQIMPFIPYHSCIMDVMLKPVDDMKGQFICELQCPSGTPNWRVHLLEFNPFYADGSSGSCLFEWKQDMPILYHLNPSSATFRIRVKKNRKLNKKNAFVIDV